MVDKITNNKMKILDLYRSNYLSQYHVREIANLLGISHVTLLPHLKDLENDKILTPKIIGKNKVYSLNLQNIMSKEYLVLAEKYKLINYLEEFFLIKKITFEISNFSEAGSFVLFGSYAKKTFDSNSDIDVFYLGDSTDMVSKFAKLSKIYGKTINLKKASLSNFSIALRKKDALVMEVVKSHITLNNSELLVNLLWSHYNEISQG